MRSTRSAPVLRVTCRPSPEPCRLSTTASSGHRSSVATHGRSPTGRLPTSPAPRSSPKQNSSPSAEPPLHSPHRQPASGTRRPSERRAGDGDGRELPGSWAETLTDGPRCPAGSGGLPSGTDAGVHELHGSAMTVLRSGCLRRLGLPGLEEQGQRKKQARFHKSSQCGRRRAATKKTHAALRRPCSASFMTGRRRVGPGSVDMSTIGASMCSCPVATELDRPVGQPLHDALRRQRFLAGAFVDAPRDGRGGSAVLRSVGVGGSFRVAKPSSCGRWASAGLSRPQHQTTPPVHT